MPRPAAQRPSKPAAARSRPAPAAEPARVSRGLLLVMLAALVASVIAAVQLHALWRSLPGPARAALNRDVVRSTFARARPNYTAPARQGLLLVISGQEFNDALRNSDRLPALADELRNRLAALRDTDVGRLQFLAATLEQRRLAGQTPLEWWPAVQPLLAGLRGGRFRHFLNELLAAEAAVYQELGLRPAVALCTAQDNIGWPHGPYLQVLAARLTELAAALAADGQPEAAATCRTALREVLRQWVLEPGPPSVRLLAADLLARELESAAADDPAMADDAAASIIEKCRAWRTRYHARAAAAPEPPLVLRLGEDPPPAPFAVPLRLLAWALWLAAAAATAGVVAILTYTRGWRRGVASVKRRGRRMLSLAPATVLLIGGGIHAVLRDTRFDQDLRRLDQAGGGWPTLVWLAVGATVMLLAAAAALHARRKPPQPRRAWLAMARTAATTWLALALAALLSIIPVRNQMFYYEMMCARGLEAATAAIASPLDHTLIAVLEAWRP